MPKKRRGTAVLPSLREAYPGPAPPQVHLALPDIDLRAPVDDPSADDAPPPEPVPGTPTLDNAGRFRFHPDPDAPAPPAGP